MTLVNSQYRMPGEFEPVEAVWLSKPVNRETWPGCFDAAAQQHEAMVAAIEKVVRVELIGRDYDWPINDAWIRDYGPIFVVKKGSGFGGQGSGKKKNQKHKHEPDTEMTPDPKPVTVDPQLACHDFVFNGWGGKYNNEYGEDDITPRRIAEKLNIPVRHHALILEGGSIDVNGAGTVMTTSQCLLNNNRNPQMTREKIEAELHATLGTTHAIWLPGGIVGDDTDGHIDDIARFVDPETVLAVAAPQEHADHAVLSENLDALRQATDQDGNKLNIVELPAPEPMTYDFPEDRFGPGGRSPVPASYANFLIANDHVFVPVFDQAGDDEALKIIEKTTGKTAIGIRAEHLVVGLGAVHCLTMQQPRVSS